MEQVEQNEDDFDALYKEFEKPNDPEWNSFMRNARRFDLNDPDKRYGIVNPSVDDPKSEADMLYAADVRDLRRLHIQNWPAYQLREHLDWLERMDGKKPSGYTSFTPELSRVVRRHRN